MVTLRVYDSAARNKQYKDYVDRYCLYVPSPRNMINKWGVYGVFLGFSFNDRGIIRCNWDECKNGVKTMNLGKKIKRDTLPKHVQKWVNTMEEKYNRALKENTKEAWYSWNRA